jgi:hypothetical protein
MNKKDLSERDIIVQFIMPAIKKAGWNIEKQVREEVYFTDGRIYVKGNKTARGERKFADIILYHKTNIPIAIIEAKDTELELIQDDYTSPIPAELQWRNWAADSKGITGDKLKDFVDQKLFPGLNNLDIKNPHITEEEHSYSSKELLSMLHESFRKSDELLDNLMKELG